MAIDNPETPYVLSDPPENPSEFRSWMYNEIVRIHRAIDSLRIANAARNNAKWDDLRFPVTGLAVNPGTNLPSSTFALDAKMFMFLDTYTSTASLYFIAQLPHAWKEDSSVGPHIHTCNINGISGQVQWGMTYRWVNPFDIVGSATDIVATQTLSGTADKMDIIGFPKPVGTDKNISSTIFGRVYRLGGDAADTATGGIALVEKDIHYARDADGSRQEYIK